MVANPARGQLNREMSISSPRSLMRIWSREMGLAGPSRVSPLILLPNSAMASSYYGRTFNMPTSYQ